MLCWPNIPSILDNMDPGWNISILNGRNMQIYMQICKYIWNMQILIYFLVEHQCVITTHTYTLLYSNYSLIYIYVSVFAINY